jgi:hypothetical protein
MELGGADQLFLFSVKSESILGKPCMENLINGSVKFTTSTQCGVCLWFTLVPMFLVTS